MACWWSVSSPRTWDCWEPQLCAAACMSTPTLWAEWYSEEIRFSLEELNLKLVLPCVQICNYKLIRSLMWTGNGGCSTLPVIQCLPAPQEEIRGAGVKGSFPCSHCLAESWPCFSCSFVTCVLDSKCWVFRRANVLNDCLIFSIFKGFSPTNIWHYPILWLCYRYGLFVWGGASSSFNFMLNTK